MRDALRQALQFMAVAVFLLLLPAQDLASQEAQQWPPSDEELEWRINRDLSWLVYWVGPSEFLIETSTGKVVEGLVASSGKEAVVFCAAISMAFRLGLAPQTGLYAKRRPHAITGDNWTALAHYLESEQPATGCIVATGKVRELAAQPSNRLPTSRLCKASEGVFPISLRKFKFVVKPIEPPARPSRRSEPPSAKRIRQLLAEWKRCENARCTIPYYSDDDPWVYVLIEESETQYLQIFSHDEDGRWEMMHPLSVNRPPNDLTHTVRRVKENAIAILGSLP